MHKETKTDLGSEDTRIVARWHIGTCILLFLIVGYIAGCCTEPEPDDGNSRSVSLVFKRIDSNEFDRVRCVVWDYTLPGLEGGGAAFGEYLHESGDSIEILINSASQMDVYVYGLRDTAGSIINSTWFQTVFNPNERKHTQFRFEIFADSMSKASK